MTLLLSFVPSSETHTLLPILKDADEGIERVRLTLLDERHSSYAVFEEKQLVGAMTMRWEQLESEIIYIAVQSALRGRGYGKTMITTLLFREARRRNVASLLVGTANSSLSTIAFYQRCGFRMDHVRKDFLPMFSRHWLKMGLSCVICLCCATHLSFSYSREVEANLGVGGLGGDGLHCSPWLAGNGPPILIAIELISFGR